MHPHISGVTQSGARTHSLSSLIDDEHSNHPRDLSISQNSQSNPSQYSAGPEISFHKVFVSTVRPLTYSPVTFVSSFRCTHSDVMLTTNTIFCKDGKKPPNSSVLARLPYSETQQFKVVKGGLSKHSTPMERQKEEALRKRKNKELHTEHAMFMNRLNSERDERSRLESAGAILIQKCARGWLGRPKTEYAKQLKGSRDAKQLLQNTRQRLTHDLLEMTEAVGLTPIPGMTLDSRKMMERKRIDDALKEEDDMERAAIELQSLMRQRLDAKRVDKKRAKKKVAARWSNCIFIQCHVRGVFARTRFRKLVEEEHHRAITVIQARIRAKRDRGRIAGIKRNIGLTKRQRYAAELVQSIWRGKISRRAVVAPSFEKEFKRRQSRMYTQLDKAAGGKNIELQETRSSLLRIESTTSLEMNSFRLG